MLKKHWIVVIVVAILSIASVGYMYSQNYISFEGGLHIVKPSDVPEDMKKSIEEEVFAPANVQPDSRDTNLVSKVQTITPSTDSSKVTEQPRLFDDIMKAVETFSPIACPFITFYLYTKKKKKDKNSKDDDE